MVRSLLRRRASSSLGLWLFKSEPSSFSIDHFEKIGTDMWDGIRNYQVRNLMRDEMKVGDKFFFYHSSCKQPGIVGLGEIISTTYPDPTQFDSKQKYYDPRSSPKEPRWLCLDVKFLQKVKNPYFLAQMREEPKLEGLPLLAKGNRLSIQRVEPKHWEFIETKL